MAGKFKRSFQEVYPKIVEDYWDWTRNTVTPDSIAPTANGPFQFTCPKGHSFQASASRAKTARGEFCISCSSPTFYEVFPEIVDNYWDYEANEAAPRKLKAKANGRFHFKCSREGHEFTTTLNNVPKQTREFCPECRLMKHSIAEIFPKASIMWDYEKNGKRPDEIYSQASGTFYFVCPDGHEFSLETRHLKKWGEHCRICYSQESRVEREVVNFLHTLSLELSRNRRDLISPYEIDVYFPKLRKGLEINGDFWHCDSMVSAKNKKFSTAKEYHWEKVKLGKEINLPLAFLWAHDWTEHRELVEDELRKWLVIGVKLSKLSLLTKVESVVDISCSICSKD